MLMTTDEPPAPWMGVYPTRFFQTQGEPEDIDEDNSLTPGTEAILADYLPPVRARLPQYSPRRHRNAVNKPRTLKNISIVPLELGNPHYTEDSLSLEGTRQRFTPRAGGNDVIEGIRQRFTPRTTGGDDIKRKSDVTKDNGPKDKAADVSESYLPRIPSGLERNPKIFQAGLKKSTVPKLSTVRVGNEYVYMKGTKKLYRHQQKLKKELESTAHRHIFTLQQPSMTSRGSRATENIHSLMGSLRSPGNYHPISLQKNHTTLSDNIMAARKLKMKLYGSTPALNTWVNSESPCPTNRSPDIGATPRIYGSPRKPINKPINPFKGKHPPSLASATSAKSLPIEVVGMSGPVRENLKTIEAFQ